MGPKDSNRNQYKIKIIYFLQLGAPLSQGPHTIDTNSQKHVPTFYQVKESKD